MRGVPAAVVMMMFATATAAAAETPGAAPASTPPPGTGSVVIQQEAGGLVFDVPLPRQRSLRDRDPKLDQLLKGLPGLGTENVPGEKAWTESLVDSFEDQLKNGPPPCQPNRCIGQEATGQRLQQMDTDFGPQDDWTWTPPSGY